MAPFWVDGIFIAACALVNDLRPVSYPNSDNLRPKEGGEEKTDETALAFHARL